jgi:molybdopterin synthase catalytic subunit
MIQLTTQTIVAQAVLDAVGSPSAGAIVLFLGTVRDLTASRRTQALDYECYAEMAENKLRQLESEARGRWPIIGCALVHRLGHLEPGEVSVAVAVSTPHRQQAFEAGQWLIDTIKQVVPIWKKEHWSDGATEWIHPVTSP